VRLGALKAGRGCGEEGKGAGMIGRLPNGRGGLPFTDVPSVGKERKGEERTGEEKERDGGS